MCVLLNENGASIITLSIICGIPGCYLPQVILVTNYIYLKDGEPEVERD